MSKKRVQPRNDCLHCAIGELIVSREDISIEDLVRALTEVLFDFIDGVDDDDVRDAGIAELIGRITWGLKLVNDREWAESKILYQEFYNARSH